jgi:hypothetical protein
MAMNDDTEQAAFIIFTIAIGACMIGFGILGLLDWIQ